MPFFPFIRFVVGFCFVCLNYFNGWVISWLPILSITIDRYSKHINFFYEKKRLFTKYLFLHFELLYTNLLLPVDKLLNYLLLLLLFVEKKRNKLATIPCHTTNHSKKNKKTFKHISIPWYFANRIFVHNFISFLSFALFASIKNT